MNLQEKEERNHKTPVTLAVGNNEQALQWHHHIADIDSQLLKTMYKNWVAEELELMQQDLDSSVPASKK